MVAPAVDSNVMVIDGNQKVMVTQAIDSPIHQGYLHEVVFRLPKRAFTPMFQFERLMMRLMRPSICSIRPSEPMWEPPICPIEPADVPHLLSPCAPTKLFHPLQGTLPGRLVLPFKNSLVVDVSFCAPTPGPHEGVFCLPKRAS